MKLKDYLKQGKQAPPKKQSSTETDWLFVERLTVSSGKLWIGDPEFSWAECREKEGCMLTVPNGTYVVEARGQEFGGPRLVTRLRVVLDGTPEAKLGKEFGEAGTDSGQLGVCDPKLFLAALTAACKGDEERILAALESAFDSECGVYRPQRAGAGCLVYVPSGFGDGGGPVWRLCQGRQTVGLETVFIPQDEA